MSRPDLGRRRRIGGWIAGAAGILVLAGVVTVAIVVRNHAADNRGTSIGVPASPLSLAERVAAASRIVVGTVTRVDRGSLKPGVEGETGEPYVLATVSIDEAMKGPAGSEVFAFSYDLGHAVTSEGATRPWSVGDHVLLFLVPDVGTVSANIAPPHLQVAEGEAGRYFVDGNRLINAEFTLDDVRRQLR